MRQAARAVAVWVWFPLALTCARPPAGDAVESREQPLTVTLTTANDLGLGGNLEGGADLDVTSERIRRGAQRYGVGSWNLTTPFINARYLHQAVAYNGWLYVLGGYGGVTFNDVRFAPLNPDGTVGAFTTTTFLPTARSQTASVAYNGYLYVIGGWNGSAGLSDVQVARINANGTLGAWSATTSLPSLRYLHSSVAYDGRLYVLGGQSGTPLAEVLVASFNADGTLGAFSPTTPLPAARAAHTSVVYGGSLYVLGGIGSLADVQVARIAADGSLSAFSATSSLPLGRAYTAAVAYSGALYVFGGDGPGPALNDVQVARIFANGALGPFMASLNMPSTREMHQAVAYNGFAYVIGGQGPTAEIRYAQLNPATAVGAWTSTTPLPALRRDHASVAHNGYLYAIGGHNGAYLADVSYAAVNPDGTVSAWVATTPLPAPRFAPAAAVWANRLYVVGGGDSMGSTNEVRFAPINTDGSLGAFTTTSSFLIPRSGHAAAAANGFLYVLGGFSGSGLRNDVQVAPINANGTLGAFSNTSSFTTPREEHTAFAHEGRVYVVAGYNGAFNWYGDVQMAPVNANGTLGAFVGLGTIPGPRSSHSTTVSNRTLYIAGGIDAPGSFRRDVVFAAINGDGTLGTFFTGTPLPTLLGRHRSVAYGGRLYTIGGYTSPNPVNTVQLAPIMAHGNVGAFATANPFTTARFQHASVAYQGYLYVIGGNVGLPSEVTDVQLAAIGADGSVGTFSTTTALPSARRAHAALAHQGRLYVSGGGGSAGAASSVWISTIGANGVLGPFTATTPLTTPRSAHTAHVYSGRYYVVGGRNTAPLASVEFAPIASDGTLGAFTATSSLTGARSQHASVVSGGRLYVLGGFDDAVALSDVQVASFNADGTLTAFSSLGALPARRRSHAAFATGGQLYMLGGYGDTAPTDDVWVGPIFSDGTLGELGRTALLPSARYGLAAVNAGGWVFITGGFSNTFLAEVRVAPLTAPQPAGRYSRLVDLGGPSSLTSLTVNGSAGGGSTRVEYRAAPVSGVLGPSIDLGEVPLGAAVPFGGATARWVSLRFTLDDTLGAAFDVQGPRDLTDFTIDSAFALTLTPASATVPPRGGQGFSCSGGTDAGFTFAVNPNNSGGMINASGAYVAGSVGGVTDMVTCTDPMGAYGTAAVTVTAGVSISPTTASTPPRGSLSFTASGGSGTGYAFTLATNASGGMVTPAGAYTAGPNGSVTDVLQAADSLGNVATRVITVTAPLALVPGSATRPPRGTVTFTTTGGKSDAGMTFGPITDSSGLTIGASSGVYTAGPLGSVLDVVGVTDALGNTATAMVNVSAGVSVAPLTVTVPPRGAQTFVASGGNASGYTWTLPSNASGATVDGGAYVAGSMPSVADLLQATDSLGNSGLATVTVGPGVSISPPAGSVAPRGALSFTASGGSDAGFTWTMQSNPSGGTVSAGAYTAGSTGPVTDVVRVTDSLGNLATVNVMVGASLAISPASPSTPPNGTIPFNASGGSGSGFTWALTSVGSNGATVDAVTGAYRAGIQNGTDVVRVTDSLSNTATVSVTVTNALAVTPSAVTLPPLGLQSFTGSGGSGMGFVWSLSANNSGATFDTVTAMYRAGRDGGTTDLVQLRDSLGNTATATVTVGPGISVMPPSANVAPRGTLAFTAAGGSGTGFTYSLSTNGSGGAVGGTTGTYVAGAAGATADVVSVTDSLGNVGSAQVTVGPGVSISPPTLTVAPRELAALSAVGGSGAGYAWSFVSNASTGALNAGTGDYRAGNMGSVSDVVRVTDALGNTAQLSITVGPGVSVSPSAPMTPPRGLVQLTAMGGSGSGFTWSFLTNRSGGTVSQSTGAYQAGPMGSVADLVQVVDSLGNSGTVTISVGTFTISPASATVAPQQTVTFTTSGGSGAVTFRLAANASGGSIGAASGVYTAGAALGVDTVEATDALGNVDAALVTVNLNGPLVLAPAMATVPPRGALSFTVMGGSGAGVVFSLATNSSGGTIDPSSGAYRAGATASVTDTVRVSDGAGATATATVTVSSGVVISPASAMVQPNERTTFTASGGSGSGFSWQLGTNASGGSIDPASGEYLAGATGNVTDEVRVSDGLGNEARASVTVGAVVSKGCGCDAGAGSWAVLALLALAARRGRRG